MKNKKKIAVYAPMFAGGGAEAVELAIVDALQYDYDVTIFTFVDIDLQQLNSFYDTKINPDLVKVNYILTRPLTKIIQYLYSNVKGWGALILHAPLAKMRQAKDDFDLLISGYNAVDLGKKGIQYLHYINVVDGRNLFYEKIFNFSKQQIRENITVTNSLCVAEKVKAVYGLDSTVIYPCVMLENDNSDWHKKENAFICSGRLVTEKAPHRVIRMVKEVRNRGFDVKLYLTGGTSNIYRTKYSRFLNKMIKENKDWVTLCKNLSYEEYRKVVKKCKYGIHFKFEPFGISVAEMVKSGAITFVKSEGGQTEIVGKENTDLFFKEESDGVETIINVLQNEATQKDLVTKLNKQKDLFSREQFNQGIITVVNNFFA